MVGFIFSAISKCRFGYPYIVYKTEVSVVLQYGGDIIFKYIMHAVRRFEDRPNVWATSFLFLLFSSGLEGPIILHKLAPFRSVDFIMLLAVLEKGQATNCDRGKQLLLLCSRKSLLRPTKKQMDVTLVV
jgi:hypothetical protein